VEQCSSSNICRQNNICMSPILIWGYGRICGKCPTPLTVLTTYAGAQKSKNLTRKRNFKSKWTPSVRDSNVRSIDWLIQKKNYFQISWDYIKTIFYNVIMNAIILRAYTITKDFRSGSDVDPKLIFVSGSHFSLIFGSGSGSKSYLTCKKFRIKFRIRPKKFTISQC
jgi:hypothetical protein